MLALNPLTDRRGTVKVMMLLWFLLLAAVGYYGIEIGGVYWRKLSLEESVRQQIGFAGQLTDEAIQARIVQDVVDLDLPPAARRVQVVRSLNPRTLSVTIRYSEKVNLLFEERDWPVSVEMRRTF